VPRRDLVEDQLKVGVTRGGAGEGGLRCVPLRGQAYRIRTQLIILPSNAGILVPMMIETVVVG
jgi:hypothetical protein